MLRLVIAFKGCIPGMEFDLCCSDLGEGLFFCTDCKSLRTNTSYMIYYCSELMFTSVI